MESSRPSAVLLVSQCSGTDLQTYDEADRNVTSLFFYHIPNFTQKRPIKNRMGEHSICNCCFDIGWMLSKMICCRPYSYSLFKNRYGKTYFLEKTCLVLQYYIMIFLPNSRFPSRSFQGRALWCPHRVSTAQIL